MNRFDTKDKISTPENDSIASTQQWMQEAIFLPSQVDRTEVENRFIPGANLAVDECLAIYQRGYILRLAKCLAEQFPALSHALGDALFDQFARQYLRVCPSDSYTLYELGRRFPGYLEEVRPDRDLPPEQREGWIDFMVDLASFERLHFNLFDAPGHEGKPWPSPDVPDHNLVLQPCFELGIYRYPVAWYYHNVNKKKATEFPPQRESYVAVLRKDYQTSTFPINRIHYLFLKKLQSCGSVSDSLAYVSDRTDISIAQVTDSWREAVRAPWIEAGFFYFKHWLVLS